MKDFHYQLKHVPGAWNQVDALSRRPDYNDGSGDNDQVVALPDEVFIQVLLTSNLVERLHCNQKTQHLQLEKWKMKHQLELEGDQAWYKNHTLVVVGKEKDKMALLEIYHDSPAAGHPGQSKTLAALRRDYWWPEMRTFV